MSRNILIFFIVVVSAASLEASEPTTEQVREAMERGLAIVQTAADNYPSYRDCFSCHHQTLPVLAMVSARRAGAEIDEDLLEAINEFTADSFRARIENLHKGEGIGGRSMTVGYGLWTFEEAARPADDLTEAMVTFLLKNQDDSGRWRSHTGRPPLEGSHVTCTTLAAYNINLYASDGQRVEVDEAVEKARNWLIHSPPTKLTQEDRNARLWGLDLLGADPEPIEAAREAVLEAQAEDGGWAQEDGMNSDAYATGQALTLLSRTGLERDHPALQRGIRFLIDTQCEDGSWKVETRAKPVQVFFDNGDPHGKSQFLSISATSWAVAALAGALGPQEP
ncbi:terpene cyclase/mutase family protein [soil metagenome]